MAAGAFNEAAFAQRLLTMTVASDSITSTSKYVRFNARHSDKMAKVWHNCLLKQPVGARLPLMYLLNDVLQHAVLKNTVEIITGFAPMTLELVRRLKLDNDPNVASLRRVVKIWHDREMLPAHVLELMDNILDGKVAPNAKLVQSSVTIPKDELVPPEGIVNLQLGLRRVERQQAACGLTADAVKKASAEVAVAKVLDAGADVSGTEPVKLSSLLSDVKAHERNLLAERASRVELLGLLQAVQQLTLPGEPAAQGMPATPEEGLRRYIADCDARLAQLDSVTHLVRDQAWIPSSAMVPGAGAPGALYAAPSDPTADLEGPASHKRRRLGVEVPGMHGSSRWDAGGGAAAPMPYTPTVADAAAATIGSALAAGAGLPYGAGPYVPAQAPPHGQAYGHNVAMEPLHGQAHHSHYDDRDHRRSDGRHTHRRGHDHGRSRDRHGHHRGSDRWG